MALTLFTALTATPNEYGRIAGGEYQFEFDGQAYRSWHLANRPAGLERTFQLDIELSESNFFAHTGAQATFFTGGRLGSGAFARSQAFAAYATS